MIKVVVVDDQQLIREGLAALLGLLDDVEILGTASDGEQALRLVAQCVPDVVLMDLRMPVMDGVAATRRIVAHHPGTAVVVLTTYTDDESIGQALAAGARGYLTKNAGRAEIAAALRSAVVGHSTFDAQVSDRLVAALTTGRLPSAPEQPLPDGLTSREAEVLGLLRRGLSNREIAKALFIGASTVKTHINNAFAKIGVRNRVEAAHYAERHQLNGPAQAITSPPDTGRPAPAPRTRSSR
ncbi:response regulator [Nonomuraea jiangxiensis]|uniref:DNA-binding response regulator, NarL/FixJ family, contains REC and HTH domains n=1 Tax=Nonomuraea jiangxiensis TaxID=633440 RepID=A0A1G8QF05_9ACTN|nr:response regulator transcription factor [Nonomuraea jiangxiensis]SDJ03163.1 DNA-binding response regulator, NarL/FixJ family, contains REC and HTH domains [Nonomuraea jiangxiensis]